MFNFRHLIESYKDFAQESEIMNYSNNLRDKYEFIKMFLNGDYDYNL